MIRFLSRLFGSRNLWAQPCAGCGHKDPELVATFDMWLKRRKRDIFYHRNCMLDNWDTLAEPKPVYLPPDCRAC